MTIRKLEELEAWQEARLLCKWIYILTENYPKSEEYNLKKHMRESSRGTASNIGEGFGRYFFKEHLRYYGIAKGCLNEVKSDLYISCDVNYVTNEILNKYINQTDKVEAKINGLITSTLSQMRKHTNRVKSRKDDEVAENEFY